MDRFLLGSPHDGWSNAYLKGQRYGEMYSNAAESFKSRIREARHLLVMKMVDMVGVQIIEQMTNRREVSSRWKGVICPNMRLEASTKLGKPRSVWHSSNTVYDVHLYPSVTVNLYSHICSCYQ